MQNNQIMSWFQFVKVAGFYLNPRLVLNNLRAFVFLLFTHASLCKIQSCSFLCAEVISIYKHF